MPAIRRTTFTEFIWRLHRFVYRASGGGVGGAIGGASVLLLTTTGRHSGEPRPVTLTCFEDGGRFVVVASNAGEDRHPAWWLNLKVHPEATLLIGGTTYHSGACRAGRRRGTEAAVDGGHPPRPLPCRVPTAHR
jgi:deazaflavin-dependent oxidoreductase (nitroreductase family)